MLINKIISERGNSKTIPQRIMRDRYEQLYDNKLYANRDLYNLQEMDIFLEIYNPPRLNHEKVNTLNRHIMNKEIELLRKNCHCLQVTRYCAQKTLKTPPKNK